MDGRTDGGYQLLQMPPTEARVATTPETPTSFTRSVDFTGYLPG